jgi:two-component system NtrC family response regulator
MTPPGALLEDPAPAPPRLAEVAARIARTDLPLLITGEIGSGKRHLARWIHDQSPRAGGPLIEVPCAALPTHEVDEQLFGSTRGEAGIGDPCCAVIAADGGTLLLANVEALSSDAQRRVLRLVSERRVDLASAARREADLRIVATSCADLAARAASGEFRDDLYYQLQVVHLELPPLRSRREQLDGLVRLFVASLAGQRRLGITHTLLDEMRNRSWPGNVLQLRNACEQLVASCPHEVLRVEDLPPDQPLNDIGQDREPSGHDREPGWPALPPDGLGLFELERRVIHRVLERENGNVTRAAAYLRIPRHILAYRMRKYGLRRG